MVEGTHVILSNLGSGHKLSFTLPLIALVQKCLTGHSAEMDCKKLSCFSEGAYK